MYPVSNTKDAGKGWRYTKICRNSKGNKKSRRLCKEKQKQDGPCYTFHIKKIIYNYANRMDKTEQKTE